MHDDNHRRIERREDEKEKQKKINEKLEVTG